MTPALDNDAEAAAVANARTLRALVDGAPMPRSLARVRDDDYRGAGW
ncbi:MAG: hypothetical protein IAG13_00280 [Deltaproteobacteria bacterium]|nr:hypothetical protein [Nannocystaceae bacterium]